MKYEKQLTLFPILNEQRYRKNQVNKYIVVWRIEKFFEICNELPYGKGRIKKIGKTWGVNQSSVNRILSAYHSKGYITDNEWYNI